MCARRVCLCAFAMRWAIRGLMDDLTVRCVWCVSCGTGPPSWRLCGMRALIAPNSTAESTAPHPSRARWSTRGLLAGAAVPVLQGSDAADLSRSKAPAHHPSHQTLRQREGAHRPKGAAPAALQTPRPQPETRPCSCYDSTRDWSTQDKAASGLRASTSCSASWQTTSSTAPSRIGARARGPAFARGGPCELTAPCARAQDTHEITQGQGTPPVPSRTASRRAIR